MSNTQAVCGQCNGSGKIFFRPNTKRISHIDCDLCQGTGVCEKEKLWELQGKSLLKWRTSENLTLREAARKYNIDASNLSKMERGLIKPDPQYMKLTITKL